MRKGSANPFFGKKHRPDVIEAMRARAVAQHETRQYDIQPITIRNPTADQCAYIAGLIDGEGSITFKKGQPTIVIYNCHEGLMRWLVTTVGGAYRMSDRRGREPNYSWSIGGARNCALLNRLTLPHLIIKRHLAVGMIDRLQTKYGARLHG